MTGIRIGGQVIQFSVEEAADLIEDPVAALAGAYFYHGNKGVDWAWAIKDYVMGSGLPPEMVTEGTKRMFRRFKNLTKRKRGSTVNKGGASPKPRPLSRR